MTTLKRRSAQLLLSKEWDDITVHNHHDAQVIVGDFFEELASCVLHFPRLATNGQNTICPDLQHGEIVVESKASNRRTGKQYLLWDHQIENYERMELEEDVIVFYLFWSYEMTKGFPDKVGSYRSRDALRRALSQSAIRAWFVPLTELSVISRKRKLETYHKTDDPHGRGYFYRVRPAHLIADTEHYKDVPMPPLVVYDEIVGSVKMRMPTEITRRKR